MRAVSESEIINKYLVSRESYLAKKKSGARIQESETILVSRIALEYSDE